MIQLIENYQAIVRKLIFLLLIFIVNFSFSQGLKTSGKKIVDKDEAISLLKSASIMNLVGKETISLAIDLGIGSESGVKIISDIPFLIIFNA